MRKGVVSVCIPTYNNPVGLKKTLENITTQTYKDLEIIISDNCSPGTETQDVIQSFARKDPRIQTHLQKENTGVLYNYQFTSLLAIGEYLMFAQDDDDWSNTFIENLVAEHERVPGTPVVICPTRYRNNDTGELSEVHDMSSLSPYRTVGCGDMGFAVMGVWRTEDYHKFAAMNIPLHVSGVDHTTGAHALLYNRIGVVPTEWYHKGFHPGRFEECFSIDLLYSFRAWYYFVVTLTTSHYLPLTTKLRLPAIAIWNFARACAITGVQVVISMPDNPVKRLVQRRFFGAN